MNITNPRRSALSRQLEAYEESWKSDYLAAQDCCDWEELIAVGLAVGEALERVNHQWREAVFRGSQELDARMESLIRDMFRLWLTVTEAVLARAAALSRTFGSVAGFAELSALKTRTAERLANWTMPTLAAAVGSRDQQLTAQDAAALDALAAQPAPPPPVRRFEEQDSSFLK